MNRLLVILGLVIVPFYEIILKALPFVKSVAPDTRAPKAIIALVFALSIGLLAVFQGIKPFRNKWLLIIPVYLLFNLIMAPHVDMFINNVESGDFYFWKPFTEVLIFTLMVVAVASMDIKFDTVLLAMVVCGTFMAGYVVLQKLGFDQFWIIKPPPQWVAQWPDSNIGGNLGQSTIVASFIVMLIPLAIYLRRFWMAAVMIIGTLITRSDMALLAIGFMGILTLAYFKKFLIAALILSMTVLPIAIGLICFKDSKFSTMIVNKASGRFEVWKNVYTDIRDGAIEGMKQDFSITGVGFGRFPFIFPDRHQSEFQQAHNDILEFTYNCGIVGLWLLLAGLFVMAFNILCNLTPFSFAILLSFLTILFCSLGSFPFQLGAHQFYSATLLGLLHNDSIIRRG